MTMTTVRPSDVKDLVRNETEVVFNLFQNGKSWIARDPEDVPDEVKHSEYTALQDGKWVVTDAFLLAVNPQSTQHIFFPVVSKPFLTHGINVLLIIGIALIVYLLTMSYGVAVIVGFLLLVALTFYRLQYKQDRWVLWEMQNKNVEMLTDQLFLTK